MIMSSREWRELRDDIRQGKGDALWVLGWFVFAVIVNTMLVVGMFIAAIKASL